MAGENDEVVASDELVDTLTTPRRKPTYQDAWNAAYRGLVPHGMNARKDMPGAGAPVLPNGGPDAEPFSETAVNVVEPDIDDDYKTTPVVIIDDLTRVKGLSDNYFQTYQVQVGAVGTTQIVNKDPSRTRVVLMNMGPGNVYLGATESVGYGGSVILASGSDGIVHERVINTTQEIWAQQVGGQSGTAILHITCEYVKEL